MQTIHKAYLMAALTVTGVLAFGGVAAAEPLDAGEIAGDSATSIVEALGDVLTTVVPIAAVIAAAVIGIHFALKLIRKFVSS